MRVFVSSSAGFFFSNCILFHCCICCIWLQTFCDDRSLSVDTYMRSSVIFSPIFFVFNLSTCQFFNFSILDNISTAGLALFGSLRWWSTRPRRPRKRRPSCPSSEVASSSSSSAIKIRCAACVFYLFFIYSLIYLYIYILVIYLFIHLFVYIYQCYCIHMYIFVLVCFFIRYSCVCLFLFESTRVNDDVLKYTIPTLPIHPPTRDGTGWDGAALRGIG